MAQIVIATDGKVLDLDSSGQNFSYNLDGTLNYIEVVSRTITYRQTYTYTNSKVTAISQWINQ